MRQGDSIPNTPQTPFPEVQRTREGRKWERVETGGNSEQNFTSEEQGRRCAFDKFKTEWMTIPLLP